MSQIPVAKAPQFPIGTPVAIAGDNDPGWCIGTTGTVVGHIVPNTENGNTCVKSDDGLRYGLFHEDDLMSLEPFEQGRAA